MTLFLAFSLLLTTLKAVRYDYNYTSGIGPNDWPDLFPTECDGERQSPINVDTTTDVTELINEDACESGYFVDFDLSHSNFKLWNNQHGFQMAPVDTNGDFLRTNTTAIAKLKNVLYDEHPQYCFDSVHFHFGPNATHGSEHHLDGTQYPIEAHFVFYSCFYEELNLAVDAHNNGEDGDTEILAVLGIFFEVGAENTAYADVTPHINFIVQPGNSTIISADFSGFFGGQTGLDEMVETVYMYDGSLTTPRCFQAVLWHVSSTILQISQAQLDTLYTIKQNDTSQNLFSTFGNYRPLQDRGSRELWKLDCASKACHSLFVNLALVMSFCVFWHVL